MTHALDKLELLLRVEAGDRGLENRAKRDLVDSDKGVEVHVSEETHDELTIHAVSDASVSGNGVTEILDLECALKSRSEETAKGSDKRSKSGQVEGVDLHGSNSERDVLGSFGEEEQIWHLVGLGEEGRVRIALQASEDVGTQVVDRADEVLGSHHDAGKDHGENDSHDPGTDKTLDSLLGRELDELGTSKENTANVSEDIVGDDQSSGQEEPDHALEDVVHDEMSLNHNEVQSHVCPGKVGELELVVTSLKRSDKEDESYILLVCRTQRRLIDIPNT